MSENAGLSSLSSCEVAALRQRAMELEQREREHQSALQELRRRFEEMEQSSREHAEELARANAALRQEIADRKRVEEALRESEGKWRTVVEAVPDFIILFDRQGSILFINRILPGYRVEEVIGRSSFEFMPVESHALQREALARLFDTGEPYELEVRGAGSPGEVRWYANRGRPISRDGQVVAALQVSSDITRRKRNEERIAASLREKESLLHEIHHRVKNNLQVISSLLALQADQLGDERARAAFLESRNRVRTMAVIHESLYRSGRLDRIDLGQQVESLCINLLRSYGVDPGRVRLDLRPAEVLLNIDRAVPCGLLLNELVSNALKYAFPGDREGTIQVRLDAGTNGEYTLKVADDGVGLPPGLDLAHTSTLGLQLIDTLVRQLGGRLEVDRRAGAAFHITFSAGDLSAH
jgi:PAS domain S-box-containing protein